MSFFRKKIIPKPYDKENKKPMIKASVCNDIRTGKWEEVMLIKTQADLAKFKEMYGIEGEIPKEY